MVACHGLFKHFPLKRAIHMFHAMGRQCIRPDSTLYSSLLQHCVNTKSLSEGKAVHAHLIANGFFPDISLDTRLVIMYAKCGNLAAAHRVFDKTPERNVVSWTAMIAAYARNGRFNEALEFFSQMQLMGVKPNCLTYASVLPACANLGALEYGKKIHEGIINCGFQSNIFVANALVDMYAKCLRIEDSFQVFDKMPERDVVSWNAMVAGYAQNGHVDKATEFFQKTPERNVVSWNGMIAGYVQNGHVDEATRLFQKMPEQNVVSWTAMLAGYDQNGHFNEALKIFREMELAGIKPVSVTFGSVLSACANLSALKPGKEAHGNIIRNGFGPDILMGNALVHMYAKCGTIDDAWKAFDKMPERDVVSWNVMIAGYEQKGYVDEAVKFFQKMPERNVISWNAMIAGVSQNGHVDEAVNLFEKMRERNVVSWNAMIAGYAQNGHVDEALKLFQIMPQRSGVSWTAMIAGLEQNGYFNESMKFFQQMQFTGAKPDSVTFTSVLPACANLAALRKSKEIHAYIIKSGFQSDKFVSSALVDMYGKCGVIKDAWKVFDEMPERGVVSWNAMIAGYAMHGCGKEALQLFEHMQHSSIKPNHVTFIGVLSACCHAGLVDHGFQYFGLMSQDYDITPAVEHYCCMVDILGRAGHLDEAQDFINKMPIKPNAAVWGSLLGACRIHCNIEVGAYVAERLFELEPQNAGRYVLLSNIYAAASRWKDAEKVRKMMKDRRVKKSPGCSWIEVNGSMYSFLVGDRSHPQMHKIHAELEKLSGQMKEAGYVPDTNLVLHDVEEEQKEPLRCHHSQKLPAAFCAYPHASWDIYTNCQKPACLC